MEKWPANNQALHSLNLQSTLKYLLWISIQAYSVTGDKQSLWVPEEGW